MLQLWPTTQILLHIHNINSSIIIALHFFLSVMLCSVNQSFSRDFKLAIIIFP